MEKVRPWCGQPSDRTANEQNRCTRYEAMNGGAKCKKMGWFALVRGPQGHEQYRHLIERIRLPIQLYRNYAAILYRFRNIASYLSKVANFNIPHV